MKGLVILVLFLLASFFIIHKSYSVIIPHTGIQGRFEEKAVDYTRYPELEAVGKLLLTKQDGSKEICTGTLITLQHVITAAHCTYKVSQATFTLKLKDGRDQSYDVRKLQYNPKYPKQRGKDFDRSHDIGIATLAKKVEESILLPKLYGKSWLELTRELEGDVEIRSVGYGIGGQAKGKSATEKVSAPGTKRSLKVFLKPMVSDEGYKYLEAYFQDPTKQIWPPLPTTYGTTAPGDSGSPNFLKTKDSLLVLIAIHSFAIKKGNLSAYKESGYKAPISENMDFIKKIIGPEWSKTQPALISEQAQANQSPIPQKGKGADVLNIYDEIILKSGHKKKIDTLIIHPLSKYKVIYPGFVRSKKAKNEGRLTVAGRVNVDQMTSSGDIHVMNGGYLIAQDMTHIGDLTVTESPKEPRDSFYQSQKTTIKGGELEIDDGIANIETLTVTDNGTIQVVSDQGRLRTKNIYLKEGAMILVRNPHFKAEKIVIGSKGELRVSQGAFKLNSLITLMLGNNSDKTQTPYIDIDVRNSGGQVKDLQAFQKGSGKVTICLDQELAKQISQDPEIMDDKTYVLMRLEGDGQDFAKISEKDRPQIVLADGFKNFLTSQQMEYNIIFQKNEVLLRIKGDMWWFLEPFRPEVQAAYCDAGGQEAKV